MSKHGYESGRLDLPFVGISTFGKRPYVSDWTKIDADVAVVLVAWAWTCWPSTTMVEKWLPSRPMRQWLSLGP